MTAPARPPYAAYQPIGALKRGLVVLREVGRHGADVAMIAKHTGINRTTIYRILATLAEDGYLIRSPTDHQYRLSPMVRQLSDGFTDELWITQVAAPALLRLARQTSWPGSVATFDGRHMVLHETTHRFSSFLLQPSMVGRQAPLSTSLGLAYLAFSAESVWQPAVDDLVEDWAGSGFGQIKPGDVERVLARIRARGYATTVGSLEPSVAAVAMPIINHSQVQAAFNVVTRPEVIQSPRLLDPIIECMIREKSNIESELKGDYRSQDPVNDRRPPRPPAVAGHDPRSLLDGSPAGQALMTR